MDAQNYRVLPSSEEEEEEHELNEIKSSLQTRQAPALLRATPTGSSRFFSSSSSKIYAALAFILLTSLIIIFLVIALHPPARQLSAAQGTKLLSHLDATATAAATYLGLDWQDRAKTRFVEAARYADIDGELDLSSLTKLCARTTWHDGLVFALDDETYGGFCNVRNVFINYLRFAIEAGATGFVLPKMAARSPVKLLALNTHDYRDFSYLFDRAHIKAALATSCPKMMIYDNIDAARGLPFFRELADGPKFAAHYLVPTNGPYWVLDPPSWRSAFDTYLNTSGIEPSVDSPYLSVIQPPGFSWKIVSDPPQLVRTLGRLFQPERRIRAIAAKVLYEMDQKFALGIDPVGGVQRGMFYGAHLRTELDAQESRWPGYDTQAPFYMQDAMQANLSIIYAASNREDDLARFKTHAKQQYGIEVTTKYELLKLEDLEELRELTFDQAGIVDYHVLLRSSRFAGIEVSSFAYNIAAKRASTLIHEPAWTAQQSDFAQRPWWNQGSRLGRPTDSLSTIIGTVDEALFSMSIWP